jgi:DNA-binding PadR family transcriptional regulator
VSLEVLKGHADLLVLAAVSEEPAHGYVIVEAIRARSAGAFDLAEGTIYPALYRLERLGLLQSSWVGGGARRRRVYRLTRRGRAALGRERNEWEAYVTAMNAALA